MPKADKSIPAKYNLFPKASLAYTVSEDGNPLYSGKRTENKHLNPKQISKDMTTSNSEFAVRPGFALSYMAASMAEGKETMDKFFAPIPSNEDVDCLDEDSVKNCLKETRAKLAACGIIGAQQWMQGEGKVFCENLTKLNVDVAKRYQVLTLTHAWTPL